MNKNFTEKLTEEQRQIALEIADKAEKMGIDPRLAVALAFRESSLNPSTKDGTSGEIGLMQVKPSTAKGMGFSVEDLRDPAKNIEIGLSYLKQNLEKFEGRPALAAAAYNAGPNHPFFSDPDKPLPPSTEKYLEDIRDLGGFTTTPAPEPEPPLEQPAPASEGDFNENKMRMLMDVAGVGAGATAAKVADVGKGMVGGVQDLVRGSRSLPGALSVLQSMQGAGAKAPPAPGMPPQAMPPQPEGMPRPVAGGPAGPVGGPASPLTQMGGSATANYGKAFGLTDIEANRALDMTKNPGGVHDLSTQRAQALQKIQQMGGGFVENPNYGGLMTAEQSAGRGPRESFVQKPAVSPSPDLPGGRPAALAQLPPAQPVSAAPPVPPQPGALSQAAGALKQGAGAVLRSPLVSGAMGGLSIAESAQEADRQIQAKDATGAAIAGTGIIGGGMQIFGGPKAKAIGALVSAASPLTLYLRKNLQNQAPMPDPTEQEMLEAQRPAFGMYPQMPRPQLRPRVPALGTNLPPVEFMR
jgi:hypothetical protein